MNRRNLPGLYSKTRRLKYLPQQISTQIDKVNTKNALILSGNIRNSQVKQLKTFASVQETRRKPAIQFFNSSYNINLKKVPMAP